MEAVIAPTRTLDVRGQICPYPDVNSMTALKQMAPGEILEILLDYPLSVERIPRSARKWGHKLLKVEKLEGTDHRLLIEAHGLRK